MAKIDKKLNCNSEAANNGPHASTEEYWANIGTHFRYITLLNLKRISHIYRQELRLPLLFPPIRTLLTHSEPSLRSEYPLWNSTGLPQPEDIDQGYFHDCYLLATLGEMAYLNPDYIKSGITEDPNHQGNYFVRLFHDHSGQLITQYVTSDDLTRDIHNGHYDLFSDRRVLWPTIAETAYALQQNADIDRGDHIMGRYGWIHHAIKAISGKPVTILTASPRVSEIITDEPVKITTQEQIRSHIIQALADRRPVVMGICCSPTDERTFVSHGNTIIRDHAYMVLGQSDDELIIRNPIIRDSFGKAHPEQATMRVKLAEMIDNSAEFVIGN